MNNRFSLFRIFTAAAAVAGFLLLAPAARAQAPINFSVVGGLSLPVGDIARTSDVGINLAFRGEGRRMTSGWSMRGDVSYDRYAGDGPIDNLSYIGLAGNLVHRGTNSSFYQYGGLGIYSSRVATNVSDASDTNLGAQLGLGTNLTSDGRVFGEAGLTSAFTSGRSSVWFPIRVGLRF